LYSIKILFTRGEQMSKLRCDFKMDQWSFKVRENDVIIVNDVIVLKHSHIS